MKPKPTVHILCGFIGAGKTTFARKLEASTGAVRITKDEWLIRLIGNDPSIAGYADIDGRICDLSRDLAFQLAARGIDVIIDEGVWEKDQRAMLRQRSEAVGARAVVHFLATPVDVMRQRVVRRNLNPAPDSFRISVEMWEGYLRFWEPPGEDEGCVVVPAED